ncbi:MAG: transketolase C-terminal domain-containing protein [Candidatus Paceibacterota bacterium]
MLHKEAHLVENIFNTKSLKAEPTRDGYGEGVVEAGKQNKDVVVLCADLAESTRSHWFKETYPERYIELGVAEQNMATVASGLANYGKIPFIASYAAFNPGRNNEQIRTTISLNEVPVKICGMHAGVSVGPDGATHQALEDIALMRVQPNMVVLVPADKEEAKRATIAAATNGKPTYLRFAREKTPVFTTEKTPFEIGKAEVLWEEESPEVAIIGSGPVLYNALLAAHELSEEGIRSIVVNNHTIKPIDEKTIISVAQKARAVVTVEEHQVAGGAGSAVTEVLAQHYPVPIEFVGVKDRFGQSGEPDELIAHYGMDKSAIIEAVKKVIARK